MRAGRVEHSFAACPRLAARSSLTRSWVVALGSSSSLPAWRRSVRRHMLSRTTFGPGRDPTARSPGPKPRNGDRLPIGRSFPLSRSHIRACGRSPNNPIPTGGTDDDTHAHSTAPAPANASGPAPCTARGRLAGGRDRSPSGQRQDRHPAPVLTRDEQHVRRRARTPSPRARTAGGRRYVRQHRDRLRRQPQASRPQARWLGPPPLHDHKHQQHRSDCALQRSDRDRRLMLLANDETFTLSASPPPTPINGGTGIYRHAHGLITPTNIGNNTDFTIKVTY